MKSPFTLRRRPRPRSVLNQPGTRRAARMVFVSLGVAFLWFLLRLWTPETRCERVEVLSPPPFLPRRHSLPIVNRTSTGLLVNGVRASLSIILPLETRSLDGLEALLLSISESGSVADVVVVAPDRLTSHIGRLAEEIEESIVDSTLAVSTIAWNRHFRADAEADGYWFPHDNSTWTLWLDKNDPFDSLDPHTVKLLLQNADYSYPVGPRGVQVSPTDISCLIPNDTKQEAAFLLPPILYHEGHGRKINYTQGYGLRAWASLGMGIASETNTGVGGVVVGLEHPSGWCPVLKSTTHTNNVAGRIVDPHKEWLNRFYIELASASNRVTPSEDAITNAGENPPPTFALIVSDLKELSSFSRAACRIAAAGHRIDIFLESFSIEDAEDAGPRETRERSAFQFPSCSLPYFSSLSNRHPHSRHLSHWIAVRQYPEVVITSSILEHSLDMLIALERRGVTVIRIPEVDLQFTDWMGSLSLEEWKAWHRPQVDISIVTNNRPESLVRLLTSLNSTHYFGDRAHLHVNAEQSADERTLGLIEGIQWGHGEVSVHHRIVLAGLLPAVVESWYPHSNDTFGLILEDDVELSPMFYAWVKMTVLHYRYGRPEDRSPNLFGISLYSQNNNELHPNGRQPFDARTFFSDTRSPRYAINTPYLSQIPCSWGALYFPEHWREFHAYLAIRFSERVLPLDSDIIITPAVRSNRWTRSWKKYFIELVYLRGYTMLYPNFADLASLSTNHLEVGSHVKQLPSEKFEKKKQLFERPLMRGDGEEGITGLMDLPEATLPAWSGLPVLDLIGHLTSEADLWRRGDIRASSLGGCPENGQVYDARHLLFCKA